MIVRCTECNAAYAVDDKKIENKKFAFSCPKCGTNVIIDNRPAVKSGAAGPFVQAPSSGDKGAFAETAKQPRMAVAEKPSAAPMDDMLSMETGEIAAEGIEDRKPVSKGAGDGMDLDFDALEGALGEEAPAGRTAARKESIPEDESLNLDDFSTDLGIELEDSKKKKPEAAGDEFEDMSFIEDVEAPKGTKAPARKEGGIDEGFDLESDIVEYEPPKSAGPSKRSVPSDDLIVDTEIKGDEIFSKDAARVDDSITIDLDSLDIELDESETKPVPSRHEADEFDFAEPVKPPAKVKKDDEFDTTIDLDSLDISLEEVEEIKKGEVVEDEERLSLEDTGLSIDELSGEEMKSATAEASETFEEDIKLNISEIDPSLTVDSLAAAADKSGPLPADDRASASLPELDMDRMDSGEDIAEKSVVQASEDYLDLEARKDFSKYRAETGEAAMEAGDTVPGGAVNFSVDYSLVFSRLGGVFRLLLLYSIVLIPHAVVLMVYSMLSSVLGFLNWMITLFTGFSETDFAEIQENTIRYAVSTIACAAGIVEDHPVYAGRKNIDHPLQLNIIYPVRYSRIWALLRLSVVGMFIAMLPHIILLVILSLGALVIAVIGILCVIATKKWPNILFDFMVRYLGYVTNVSAFMMGVIDRYPSFRFE